MTERLVSYKLIIEPHDENAKSMAKVAKELAAAVKRFEAEKVKEKKKASDAIGRERERAHGQAVALLAKETKEVERALAKQSRARETAHGQASRMMEKAARDHEKHLTKEVTDTKRAVAKMEAARSRAQAKIEVGRAQMVEGFASGTESVARFSRGFAALGLAGEENTQKLLQGLVKIQGTFDLVVGGVNAYVRLMKAVKGYMMAAEGAAATETAARGRAIAQIRLEIATENQLRNARLASGQAALISSGTRAAGGAAGAAATGAAGQAAGGTAGRAVGGAAAGAAGGAAASAGGTAALGAGAMAGLWAAAIGAVVAGGTVIKESLDGSAKDIDSWSMWIAEGQVAMANWVGAPFWKDGEKEIKEFAEAAAQAKVLLFRQEENVALDIAAASKIFGLQRSRYAAGSELMSPEQRLESTQRFKGMAGVQGQALSLQQGGGAAGLAQRRAGLVEIRNFEISIAKDRLKAQQDIGKARLKEARDAISAAQKELDIVKQRVATASESLASAKEKFGNLDPAQQRTLIRIKQKADAQGAASLTAAERAKLQSVGTKGAADIARTGAHRAADAAGWAAFGAEERKEIKEGGEKRKQLELQIQDQRKIEVEVTRQEDELVRQTSEEISRLLDERDLIIAQQIAEQVRQARININTASDASIREKQGITGRGS
jgi:hypothetical protein